MAGSVRYYAHGGAINYVMPQAIFYYDFAFINRCSPGLRLSGRPIFPRSTSSTPNAVQFQTLVEQNPNQLPASTKPTRVVADYNSRTTYVDMWNVSLQREVTNTLAVQASYVGPTDGEPVRRPAAQSGGSCHRPASRLQHGTGQFRRERR